MGTNCADLFIYFCYERDLMLSLSENKHLILFKLSILLLGIWMDDLLNIDNNYFDSVVNHIYHSELQLNMANVSDTEASFLDLHLSISDVF